MNDISFKSVFSESMNQFLLIRKASMKERTIITNKRQLKSLDDYIVEHNSTILDKKVIDGWISTLTGSESTITHAVCTIRLYISFLKQSGTEAYVPAVPKCHDDFIPYVFDNDEITAIIETADSYPSRWNNTVPFMSIEFPIIVRIALCCGLRLSECVSLKLKDFHYDTGILLVENSKGNKTRMVPIHDSLKELLQKYCLLMNLQDSESWLFPGKDNTNHVDSEKIYFRFAWVLKANGITMSKKKYERGPCFHSLRHVFVLRSFKQLSENGISVDNSVPYLSIYLGHNSLLETERYMKFRPEMFQEEFQKFYDFSSDIYPEVHYEESE